MKTSYVVKAVLANGKASYLPTEQATAGQGMTDNRSGAHFFESSTRAEIAAWAYQALNEGVSVFVEAVVTIPGAYCFASGSWLDIDNLHVHGSQTGAGSAFPFNTHYLLKCKDNEGGGAAFSVPKAEGTMQEVSDAFLLRGFKEVHSWE